MCMNFDQELKNMEHTGIEDNLASIQSPMYEELYKAAEYLEEDFEFAEDEDWNEAYLTRLKEARNILHGYRAKLADRHGDVDAILDVCEKNCAVFIDAIASGKYPDGFDETRSRTIVLLLGTANALKKGNLDKYIQTLSCQIPYILLANDSIGEADRFVQDEELRRPSDSGWISTFVHGAEAQNEEYVYNYLLQNIDPAEGKEHVASPISSVNSLLWTIESVLSIEDVDSDVKDVAIYLITEALIAQVKAVNAADNPDGSLNTPVEGILPLTFYSFDYIDAQYHKAAA